MKGRAHMGESASGRSADAGRGARRHAAGSSVLTPPTGMPAVPDLGSAVPTQRQDSPEIPEIPSTPPAPPVQAVVVAPCVCGHSEEAHEHYRPGSDCGACGMRSCAEYRAEHGTFRRLLRRAGFLA